jgi:hypothetical protein
MIRQILASESKIQKPPNLSSTANRRHSNTVNGKLFWIVRGMMIIDYLVIPPIMLHLAQMAQAVEHRACDAELAPLDWAHGALKNVDPNLYISFVCPDHDKNVGKAVGQQKHCLLELRLRLLVNGHAIGILGLQMN